jgi:ubiquinone biosynthesis protein Coq4
MCQLRVQRCSSTTQLFAVKWNDLWDKMVRMHAALNKPDVTNFLNVL